MDDNDVTSHHLAKETGIIPLLEARHFISTHQWELMFLAF